MYAILLPRFMLLKTPHRRVIVVHKEASQQLQPIPVSSVVRTAKVVRVFIDEILQDDGTPEILEVSNHVIVSDGVGKWCILEILELGWSDPLQSGTSPLRVGIGRTGTLVAWSGAVLPRTA